MELVTYIICEGAENSAEGQFVRAYAGKMSEADVVMLFACGNKNILKTFYRIVDDLSEFDRIILFLIV